VSETSELWDKIAEVDYTLHEVSNSQRKLAFEIGESLKELEIPPSAELIELGSGSGKLSSVLAEQGYHTTLMDFSPVALEKAQLFYQEKKLSGQFILGDIFNANSLLNKTYDVTWNSGVMEHFDDKKLVTLFASIYSITKKYYLCIVPNPESLPYLLFRFKAMKTGRWLYGLEFLRDDYEKIAAQAGFKLVKKKYLGLEFTQEYMNYFFGGQGSKDFQQFVENGLVPVKESYLLLYVFQVVEAQEQKTIPVNSVAEAKTIMFDYVSVLLRTNVMNTELFEEQKQRFAHETQLLLAQLDHEKEKNKIIKYILKKVRKTKARILEGNINKLFRLFRQLKEKVLFAMTLYRKYGIFFSLKNLYKECRKAGVYNTFTFVIKKIDSKNLAPNSISDEVFPPPPIVHKITFDEVFQLIKQFNTNHLIQGIICIDTAFDFDDQRNQRTIALAKTFVSLGYFVLFLRYQWNKHDHSEHDFKFFYDRMMQVPRFGMKHLLANNRFTNIQLKKYFFVTIPDEYLGSQYIDIRSNGFSMCYDILDNWEEFHLHGAAPWYKEETELFFVNNADVVSAVSKPLIDKFQHLRHAAGHPAHLDLPDRQGLVGIVGDPDMGGGAFMHDGLIRHRDGGALGRSVGDAEPREHLGFQRAVRVVDLGPDRQAVQDGIDRGADARDRRLEHTGGIRQHRDLDRIANVNAGRVILPDIGDQPHLREAADLELRAAAVAVGGAHDVLAQTDLALDDDAVDRRGDDADRVERAHVRGVLHRVDLLIGLAQYAEAVADGGDGDLGGVEAAVRVREVGLRLLPVLLRRAMRQKQLVLSPFIPFRQRQLGLRRL